MKLRYILTIWLAITLLGLWFCTLGHANEYGILTVAYEASGESYAGQIAVASVIKTRAHKRGQTIEQVVKQPYQFSCWHPKTGESTQSRKLTQRELDTARRAWNEAQIGQYDHYYAHHIVTPSWSKSAKVKEIIGNHTFMRM